MRLFAIRKQDLLPGGKIFFTVRWVWKRSLKKISNENWNEHVSPFVREKIGILLQGEMRKNKTGIKFVCSPGIIYNLIERRKSILDARSSFLTSSLNLYPSRPRENETFPLFIPFQTIFFSSNKFSINKKKKITSIWLRNSHKNFFFINYRESLNITF